MIEFKAECGHTVRAKDQDAGKAVRCSYCGKTCTVPDDKDDDLDFLFQEVEKSAVHPAIQGSSTKRRRKRKQTVVAGVPVRRGEFNPFPIILKMGYAAVLLIVVIVLVTKFVLPHFRDNGSSASPAIEPGVVKKKYPPGAEPKPIRDTKPQQKEGFLELQGDTGLFVSSVPIGASVYWIQHSTQVESSKTISLVNGCNRAKTDSQLREARPGRYIVEVVFPWSNADLNAYPDFFEFRRKIRDGSEHEARREMERFFLPDDADEMFVRKAEDMLYLVKRFDVQVTPGSWGTVRALFLPKPLTEDRSGFDYKIILDDYLTMPNRYGFDEEQVNVELKFHEVPDNQWRDIRSILAKTGAVPFKAERNRVILFKIRIEDGVFAAKELKAKP